MSNLEYDEIYPKVHVYKNVLKDPQALYEIMKNSEKDGDGKYYLQSWDKWATFGTYTQIKHQHEIDQTDTTSENYIKEKKFADQVQDAYNLVIKDYVEKTGVELPENWRFSGCSFSKYDDQIDVMSNKMTMQYHTDHITSQKDMPGEKFFITCTMYINDDYDGGDIEFYVDGNIINHKPKAGDILVFPSTEPYYHGVKTIYNGQKFFVRNFIMYTFEGTKEWLENQLKFGAYRWAKKEFERIEHDDPRNMKYLLDGKPAEYDEVQHARNSSNKKEEE
jgi:predicted 2-oxoglutarate/Fe(II)-dependent dioxygenase YbiX